MKTLADVAQLAKVSQTTASRALSRPEMVSEATRLRVLAAAKTLGYQPNLMAQGLRKQLSRIVGLLVADILNPFHAAVARGVQAAAFDYGYVLLLGNADEQQNPGREAEYLRVFKAYQVDGVIGVPTSASTELYQQLRPVFPLVEIDRKSGLAQYSVLLNNREALRLAVDHLVGLGHRHIVFVGGDEELTSGLERRLGYQEAMLAWGLEPRFQTTDFSSEAGQAVTLNLLSLSPAPTALITANNLLTVGAMEALRKLGLIWPQNLSVIGFDDTPWAALIQPPLTVLRQPTHQMGYLAGQLLFEHLAGNKTPQGEHRLPASLVLRGSTARL